MKVMVTLVYMGFERSSPYEHRPLKEGDWFVAAFSTNLSSFSELKIIESSCEMEVVCFTFQRVRIFFCRHILCVIVHFQPCCVVR